MTLGQKIRKLREEKGLTQKDLAEKMNVTFQTVSKWEMDKNEPDIATLKELSRIFETTVDCLIDEKEEVRDTHVVAIPEEDENEIVEPKTKKVSHDKYESVSKERSETEVHGKKITFGWGIAAGSVALIVSMLIFFLVPECKENIAPGLSILYSLLISYGMFALLYCILSGSYICDVFTWTATRTIKFPILIFSWSLDGFMWLIAMKILFAILGFLIGAFLFLFGLGLSMLLSAFSFPFILMHNIRTGYEDAF
ncbi:MAG: helix-turn-helix transcriptional regulator [Bacilli bacterium]|nr:helix-turn-helix transcriptional regulator [Bacilli bacterium]